MNESPLIPLKSKEYNLVSFIGQDSIQEDDPVRDAQIVAQNYQNVTLSPSKNKHAGIKNAVQNDLRLEKMFTNESVNSKDLNN